MKESLEALHVYASRIHSLISEGRGILERSDADQWQALSLARIQMLGALEEFTDFYEEHILVHIALRGIPGDHRIARIIGDRNRDLQVYYDKFVQRWTLLSPLSVSEFYLEDAKIMATLIWQTVAADLKAMTQLVG